MRAGKMVQRGKVLATRNQGPAEWKKRTNFYYVFSDLHRHAVVLVHAHAHTNK